MLYWDARLWGERRCREGNRMSMRNACGINLTKKLYWTNYLQPCLAHPYLSLRHGYLPIQEKEKDKEKWEQRILDGGHYARHYWTS